MNRQPSRATTRRGDDSRDVEGPEAVELGLEVPNGALLMANGPLEVSNRTLDERIMAAEGVLEGLALPPMALVRYGLRQGVQGPVNARGIRQRRSQLIIRLMAYQVPEERARDEDGQNDTVLKIDRLPNRREGGRRSAQLA